MSNLRNAGRQSLIITLNFNRVDDKVNEILNLCSNENTKEKIISFCNDVMSELMRNENCQTSSITVCQNCQTDKIAVTADKILDYLPSLSNDDLVYIATNIIHNIEDKVTNVTAIVNTLKAEDKQDLQTNYTEITLHKI